MNSALTSLFMVVSFLSGIIIGMVISYYVLVANPLNDHVRDCQNKESSDICRNVRYGLQDIEQKSMSEKQTKSDKIGDFRNTGVRGK